MGSNVITVIKSAANVLIDPPREWWKRAVNRRKGIKDINVHEAQALIEQGAFILDVREQHEYDAGRVPGSTLIPLGSLKSRVTEIEAFQAKKIVVICHGGKRSATACEALAQVGFSKTHNIAGGILAWKKARLSVVK